MFLSISTAAAALAHAEHATHVLQPCCAGCYRSTAASTLDNFRLSFADVSGERCPGRAACISIDETGAGAGAAAAVAAAVDVAATAAGEMDKSNIVSPQGGGWRGACRTSFARRATRAVDH